MSLVKEKERKGQNDGCRRVWWWMDVVVGDSRSELAIGSWLGFAASV